MIPPKAQSGFTLPWQIPSSGGQVQRSVHRIGGSEGGPVVVRGDGEIQSENFETGVQGWAFSADGSLEAFNGVFRGTMSTGGSGARVDIGGSSAAFIDLFSGDGDEIDNGYINVGVDNSGASDFGYINLVAPSFTTGFRSYIDIRHYDDGNRMINLYGDDLGMFGDDRVVLQAPIIQIDGPAELRSGTLGAPSLTFQLDTDSGIRRIGDGNWQLVTNATEALTIFPTYVVSDLTHYFDGQAVFSSAAYFDVLPQITVDPAGSTFPFAANWGDYGSTFLPCRYRKDADGFVHLEGLAIRSTATAPVGTVVGTLPAGYRPVATGMYWTTSSAGPARLDITSAGVVTLRTGSTTIPIGGWLPLDQVSFYAGH